MVSIKVNVDITVCRSCRKHVFVTRYYGGLRVIICKACNENERTTKVARNAYQACKDRDNGRCVQCGKTGEQVHHMHFVCFGGKSVLSNLVLLCGEHHRALHSFWVSAQTDKEWAEIYQNIEDKLRRSIGK